MTEDRPVRVKMVMVGDKAVGKSSLGVFYILGSLPWYLPYTGRLEDKTLIKNGRHYIINLNDTGSGDEYDRLRPLVYPNAEVVLLCFSVDNKESLEQIHTKYNGEVMLYCPRVPRILVACKTDLRETCEETISYDEGVAMGNKLGLKYHETSVTKNTGIEECFSAAVEEAELYKLLIQRKPRRCTLL